MLVAMLGMLGQAIGRVGEPPPSPPAPHHLVPSGFLHPPAQEKVAARRQLGILLPIPLSSFLFLPSGRVFCPMDCIEVRVGEGRAASNKHEPLPSLVCKRSSAGHRGFGRRDHFSPPAPLWMLEAAEGECGGNFPFPGKCSWWNGLAWPLVFWLGTQWPGCF